MAGTASNETVYIGYQVGLTNYTTLVDRQREAGIVVLKKRNESEFMKRTSHTNLYRHDRYALIMYDFDVVVHPVAGRDNVNTTVIHAARVGLSQEVQNVVHAT